MFTVPGWLFKLFVPGLILWGMYSIVVTINRDAALRGAKAGKGAGGEGAKPAKGEGADRGAKGAPGFTLPADNMTNALISIAIGIGIFAFAAPLPLTGSNGQKLGQVLKALVTNGHVWREPWQSLPIYSYGVMLGLSLVVGWYLVLGLCEREGLPRDKMADCYVFTAFAAIVGSRVLYIVTNLSEFPDLASMLRLRSGGLVAYGGFLGGLVGSIVFLRRAGYSLWPWADAAVPALGTGLTITRLGCYMYGCDFGRPLPVTAPGFLKRLGSFPHWADDHGAPAWQQHVQHGFHSTQRACETVFHGHWGVSDGLCRIPASAGHSIPVHPTQLYESLMGFTIFLVLMFIWRRRKWEGQIFLAFAMLYGVGRSLLEIIRDDLERGTVGPLSTSQFIGIVSALIAVPLYLYMRKHGKRADGANLFAPVPQAA